MKINILPHARRKKRVDCSCSLYGEKIEGMSAGGLLHFDKAAFLSVMFGCHRCRMTLSFLGKCRAAMKFSD